MIENGLVVKDELVKVPLPFVLLVSDAIAVAVPPKVLPFMLTGVMPHAMVSAVVKFSVGGVKQPQSTLNGSLVASQPSAFFTFTV